MKVRFTLTEQAYLDFSIHHIEHSDTQRKLARRGRLGLPIALSLMGAGLAIWVTCRFGVHRLPFSYLAGYFGVSALWYALYPRCSRKWMDKRFKAFLDEGNGKEFLGDFTLELLDDRLRVEGVNDVAEAMYGKVVKLVENKGCLYIYTGGMTAIIVPLDAFAGDLAYREFRSALEEKKRVFGEARGAD